MRIAAALRLKDYDAIVDEVQRLCYLFDKEVHPADLHRNILCLYPAGISCQNKGVTHYTRWRPHKPKSLN